MTKQRHTIKNPSSDMNKLSHTPHLMRPVWIHAASVGETRSIGCVIDRLPSAQPIHVTNRSRRALLATIPHIDHRVTRTLAPSEFQVGTFLNQTNPSIGVFVESELWPVLILRAHARGIPLLLINARLSNASYQAWYRNFASRALCKLLLSKFSFIHAQSRSDADRVHALLGNKNMHIPVGNLKSFPTTREVVNPTVVRFLAGLPLGGWAGISLHPGEEEVLMRAHDLSDPSVPLLLVPRHPAARGESPIVKIQENVFRINSYGVVSSVCEWVAKGRLQFVFMGGSLPQSTHHGGHNILEPLRANCIVGHGKYMEAFQSVLEEQVDPQVHVEMNSAEEIAKFLTSSPVVPLGRSVSIIPAEQCLDQIVFGILQRALK
jgi:3-deoxy-D-manno-octulosonic-acid transferase